jgi:NAD(P)-dependent dehydrogenase (short-subunit alcohol dehydrogenase family)
MAADLAGKVVFVTGPARGIGAEVSRQLAARGARLALAGLEPERLALLAAELGSDHAWYECDVTDQRAIDGAVHGAMQRFGAIDVVVANAGIAALGTIAITPIDVLARVVDVNLTGVVRTVSATLPHVTARRGYYLIVSSAAAFGAMPGLAVYAATKSGVEQFANALRYEVAHKGVDVGSAHPSWIDTDLVRDARAELSTFNNLLRKLPGPFGAVTPVSDCASAMVNGIAGRRRRVYVPRSLAFFAVIRHLMSRPPLDYVVRREAAGAVPEMEREVMSLGRSFGAHSVEITRSGGRRQ